MNCSNYRSYLKNLEKTNEEDVDYILEATKIAFNIHEGQSNEGGIPYICHLINVAKQVNSIDGKIVAILQHVFEFSDITSLNLKELGFTNNVISTIELLTQHKEQSYDDYILKISKNPLATVVKIADLSVTVDCKLVPIYNQTKEFIEKCEIYKKSLFFLLNHK